MSPRTHCPHCHSICTNRKTHQVSALVREITYSCNNPACGHTFIAQITPVRTLSPSAQPDPSIQLPTTTNKRPTL